MAQFLAANAVAITAASAVAGLGLGVKTSIDQRKATKKAEKNQDDLLAVQKKKQKENARAQRLQEDALNKEKAGVQKSVLGAMFQKTLSGSRIGVTQNLGGG